MLIHNYDWARSIMRKGWRLKAEKANLLNKCGCCCVSKLLLPCIFFLTGFYMMGNIGLLMFPSISVPSKIGNIFLRKFF